MAHLSRYLLRLLSFEALALFAVAGFLLFLIQCLRLFDLVSDRGQSIFTLMGQALLGMPSLAVAVLYVCAGIGLGRGLRILQENSELAVIHSSRLVAPLIRSIFAYAIGAAIFVLCLSNVVEPLSNKATRIWSENIAADLVSRSMIPHRFTEVLDGVSMIIGSRDTQGQITDFFADDSRTPELRRTYFAKRAVITRDESGYILRMFDGAVQNLSNTKRLSQISFARYDLALDELTGDTGPGDRLAQTSSIEMIWSAIQTGSFPAEELRILITRSVEGLRVLAICLFIGSLTAFPSGNRRGRGLPLEVTVLTAAFVERGITSYAPAPPDLKLMLGTLVLLGLGLLILAGRLRIFSPMRLRRA